MRTRRALVNLTIVVGSLLGSLALVEILAFHVFLSRLPFALHRAVPNVQVLAQSSKAGTVPRDYIALVGDSNAAGDGDWHRELWQSLPLTNPPFHSAHLIYERTGRDVISFGRSGAGSFDGMVFEPRTAWAKLRRSRFDVPAPSEVVAYFYEGNDLEDNVAFYRRHVGEPPPALPEADAYQSAVRSLVDDEVRGILEESPAWFEFYFAATLARALFLQWKLSGASGPSTPPVVAASVRFDARRVDVPMPLQGPAFELTEHETDLGLFVFERALADLEQTWPGTRVSVAYIPAPAGAYRYASPSVLLQSQMGRRAEASPAAIVRRSREVCRRVAAIARQHAVAFGDATPFIREAALTRPVHGPNDWKHLNRAGYEALASAVVELLAGEPMADCAEVSLGS